MLINILGCKDVFIMHEKNVSSVEKEVAKNV